MTEKSLPHAFSIQTKNGSGYEEIYSSAGKKAFAQFPDDFHLEKIANAEDTLLAQRNNLCTNESSTFLLVSFSDSQVGKDAVDIFWKDVHDSAEKMFPPSKKSF